MSKTTGRAPFEVLYGYYPRYDDGPLRHLTSHSEQFNDPVQLQESVRETSEKEFQKTKLRYDKNRYVTVKYNVGDIVFMRSNSVATGSSTKLQPKFKGPFVIVQVLPSCAYRIKYLNESKRKSFCTTVHVSDLKIWRGEYEELDDDECDHDLVSDVENNTISNQCVKERNSMNETPDNTAITPETEGCELNCLENDGHDVNVTGCSDRDQSAETGAIANDHAQITEGRPKRQRRPP